MSGGGVGGAGGGGGSRRGDGDGSRGGGIPVNLAFPLPLVDLGVPLALVAAGELASALGAGEGLLASVRADVRRQVVAAAEAAHADAALERPLACVHTHVTRQLVGAGEAAVAAVGGADVRAFMWRRLARPACGGLPDPAGFSGLDLEGWALRLCLDLRGEGFDGGERRERVQVLRQQRLLVLDQAELAVLLLRQEVVWEHRHHEGGRLEAKPGGRVGRRGALRLEGKGLGVSRGEVEVRAEVRSVRRRRRED